MREHAAPHRPPDWVVDGLLALLVAFLQVQGTVSRTEADPETVVRPLADLGHLGHLLLVGSGLVLVARRRFPVAVLAVTGVASLAYYSLEFPDGPGWIALFVALYTLTLRGDGRRSLVVAGVGIAVLAVGWLAAATDLEPRAAIGWVFFRIGASVMSAALGESVRSRRVIAAEALERAELAERTRDEEARTRVAQERVRIAREVHDTVAHAIAVINVQAGVTAHVLDKRPDRAREALETIEQTSARALHEMRTILDVLRADDDDRSPVPGLDAIDTLVDRAREAGLDVEVERAPLPVEVPGAVTTAAYRILQESITNVLRHVGPTRVAIGLAHDDDSLRITVTDEGRRDASPAPATPAEPGRGLRGMRERCELLGGRLEAGPRPGAGFEVRARLPLVDAGPTA